MCSEIVEIEDGNSSPMYTFEDFKETYVTFEGIPYESGIQHVVFLEDDSLRDGTMEDVANDIGILSRKFLNKKLMGTL